MIKRKKKARKKAKPSTKVVALRRKELSLQQRLENEFSESVKSAGFYLRDPTLLRQLVGEAAAKTASMPRQHFKDTWAYLQAMLRLVRAYYRGEYRAIPRSVLLLIVAVLVYLVNPLDLLPDWIPGIGLLDDAFIVTLAVRKTRQTLDEFMAWETSRF
jgi:uncharacterized membrane protein YkvA (DUF1232 family)